MVKKPEIILAKHSGFCFGVKRAVEETLKMSEEGIKLNTLGDLIHNSLVVDMLHKKGIRSANSLEEIEKDCTVVIRSHGVTPECYEWLEKNKIPYVNLTCPFVSRIHECVYNARDKYDLIIIVGHEKHQEVLGIKGWAGEKSVVIGSKNDNLPPANSALIVSQTTITHELFEDVCDMVRKKIPNVDVFDSICETTVKRQKETRELAQKSDAVIVIGDRKSSNTAKLYEIALKFCKKTQFIESGSELALEYYLKYGIISVVAGASTPDWIIREVITQMSELENVQATEVTEPSDEIMAEAEMPEAQASEDVQETAESAEENVAPSVASEDADSAASHTQATDENSDFLAELEKTMIKIRKGQFIKGVVVQVSDDEVCVNIGHKSDGIIRKEDLTATGDIAPAELFKPGDEIEAEVITLNDGEGNVRLSRRKIESQIRWKSLVEEMDQEKVHECKVLRVIKGGVLSRLEGYEAFIPASQLSLRYVENLEIFVGQVLPVKVIDIDKRQKRFVLSHKVVLQIQEEERERELFKGFEKGSVVKGVVKRLTEFGAFVDIGGVDGLLHITDISWVRIKHPRDVLSENQEIEVKIINVDPEKKKVSLGYKQLQPKPWDNATEKYVVGSTVTGKVVRIAPFGAFVELEPTMDGLVHISQVANRRIDKVEDVLSLGQEVEAKVLEVNPEKRRISLSMRALLQEETRKSYQEDTASPAPERPSRSFENNSSSNNSSGGSGRRDSLREDSRRHESREDRRESRSPREREERISYELPPIEEARTSLADLFSKFNMGEDD